MSLPSGAGGGGLVEGYSQARINQSLKGLVTAYNDVYAALITKMQNDFINEVGKIWSCEEAQSFFSKVVCPTVTDRTSAIAKTFGKTISIINTAANSWAQATGSTFTSQVKVLTPGNIKLDSSVILAERDGWKGADERRLNTLINVLTKINSAVDSALDKSVNCITNCGFTDQRKAQQDALVNAVKTNKQVIDQKIAEIINEFKNRILGSLEKYGGIISKNAIDFGAISSTAAGAAAGEFIPKDQVYTEYWNDDENSHLEVETHDDGTALVYEVDEKGNKTAMGWTTTDALNKQNASNHPDKDVPKTQSSNSHHYTQDEKDQARRQAARDVYYQDSSSESSNPYYEREAYTDTATGGSSKSSTSSSPSASASDSIYSSVTTYSDGSKKASVAGHHVNYDKNGKIIGGR